MARASQALSQSSRLRAAASQTIGLNQCSASAALRSRPKTASPCRLWLSSCTRTCVRRSSLSSAAGVSTMHGRNTPIRHGEETAREQ